METILTYRGKTVTAEDVAFIRSLMAEHPGESRRKLSRRLCRAWDWVQQNGELRDQVCRSLMLELERAGHLALPPKKFIPHNPLAVRQSPEPCVIDQTLISCSLSQLPKIEFRQVRRAPLEGLFNSLIEQYHYLGYGQPVGEHLKYLVIAHERPIACFTWSSAPRHIGSRDRFIGWTAAQRRNNLHLLAYNSRFLILPWVSVPHLASHLLSKLARMISSDWQRIYGHPLYFLETFVDTERFRGTCYQAANWIRLGLTTGRGKNDHTMKPNRSIKAVWGYPLNKHFREKLCQESLPQ